MAERMGFGKMIWSKMTIPSNTGLELFFQKIAVVREKG